MALFFLLLTVGVISWCLWHRPAPDWADDPEFRQWLKQSRRAQRRLDWHKTREVWRTDLWHAEDAPYAIGLVALIVSVWLASH